MERKIGGWRERRRKRIGEIQQYFKYYVFWKEVFQWQYYISRIRILRYSAISVWHARLKFKSALCTVLDKYLAIAGSELYENQENALLL